jgi:hypothetical protein
VIDSFKNIALKTMKIRQEPDHVFAEDQAIVYNNFSEPPPKGVKVSISMTLSKTNSAKVLKGVWSTNKTKEYSSVTGTINLVMQTSLDTSKIIAKVKELNLDKTLSFLEQKQSQVTAAALQENTNKEVAKYLDPDKKINDVALNDRKIEIDKPVVSDSLKPINTASTIKKKEAEKPVFPKPVIAVNKNRVSDSIKHVTAAAIVKKKEVQKPAISKPAIAINRRRVSDSEKNTTAAATIINKEVEKALPKPESTKNDSVKSPPVTTKPPPQPAASQLATRQIENIRNVSFKSDSLVISLYDNGEIDGDTVSVVLNGNILIARQGLSTNAITKTIYPSQGYGDSLQLIMYAENLGSIPPNTGLLILQDGDDRYEIRFAGDLQKNSSIILKRK